MTLDEFGALMKTADPVLSKFKGDGKVNYTTWAPYKRTGLHADGQLIEPVWKVQVDRFTKIDNDPVAAAIDAALLGSDDIAVTEYQIDYEKDTGYIHHIWDIEVS